MACNTRRAARRIQWFGWPGAPKKKIFTFLHFCIDMMEIFSHSLFLQAPPPEFRIRKRLNQKVF
jgi:hypothetical protein